MLDHVSIGVADLVASRAFYTAALAPLGCRCLAEGTGWVGFGDTAVSFYLHACARPVVADADSGLHFCFAAEDVTAVRAFHAAAMAAGGRDNGAPGKRIAYGPDYFAAFVIDPDGYRLEAHFGNPE